MAAIASLRLIDYRSYSALDTEFHPGVIALFGPNGAGKTNLLEAISLLSPGRGLRRAKTDALARICDGSRAPGWGINAFLYQPDDQDKLQISIGQVPEQANRRLVRIDGRQASGTELAKYVSLLWLTPAQDRLFTGPASDRRKFIDRFALAYNAEHGSHAIRFEKARSERNRLLSDGVTDWSWYNAIEADLADFGAKMAQTRVLTIEQLQVQISSRETIFPRSLIGLDGLLEGKFSQGQSLPDVTDFYRACLKEDRSIDLRAGRTLKGPHRTELHVTHAAKAMPAGLCSTGEQKALLIGLILAQARALKDKAPILLLDEVAAHLDEIRRAALAEELLDLGLQVFMTGTDKDLFSDFGDQAQQMKVSDGHIDAA